MAGSTASDELFMAVLNRWRELGGLVGGGEYRKPTVVEQGDEAALRNGDWIFLAPGEETEEHLKAFEGGVTRALDATYGKPGREGIESWGDWEIYVDRKDKTESCANLVDLALYQLKADASWSDTCDLHHKDGTVEKRPTTMLGASSFMQPTEEASWEAVLSKIGQDLEESLFGAEGTQVECAVSFEDDGNTRCFLVDVGSCMYICCLCTS